MITFSVVFAVTAVVEFSWLNEVIDIDGVVTLIAGIVELTCVKLFVGDVVFYFVVGLFMYWLELVLVLVLLLYIDVALVWLDVFKCNSALKITWWYFDLNCKEGKNKPSNNVAAIK